MDAVTSNFVTREVHDEFARRIDEENNRQNKRLDSLENGMQGVMAISVNVERLAANIEQMTKILGEQGERLKAIEEKPAKKWETVVTAIISVAVGFLLNMLMTGKM